MIFKIWSGNDESFVNLNDMEKMFGDWTQFSRICAECHYFIATENFSILYISVCCLMGIHPGGAVGVHRVLDYALVFSLPRRKGG